MQRSALVLLSLSLPTLAEATPVKHRLIFASNPDRSVTRVDVVPQGLVVTTSGNASVAAVSAEIESDGGSEDVELIESNAWLHGSVALRSLPASGATVDLTLYDSNNQVLARHRGYYGGVRSRDGNVWSLASTGDSGCTTREGCTALDMELLAAEHFEATNGYELAIDLAGVDTERVAYGALTVTERGAGEDVCVLASRAGCLEWSQNTVVTTTEVDWEEVGRVWEVEPLLSHEGVVDVKAEFWDSRGRKIDAASSKLGEAWLDGGEGVGVLTTDEDPLTTVGLLRGRGRSQIIGMGGILDSALVVSSGGWSTSDPLPTHAQVEMVNGESATIPANSFQRILWRMRQKPEVLYQAWDDSIHDYLTEIQNNPLSTTEIIDRSPIFHIGIDGRNLAMGEDSPSISGVTGQETPFMDGSYLRADLNVMDLSEPVCTGGYCLMLVADGSGGYDLSLSQYRWDSAFVGGETNVVVTMYSPEGEELFSDEWTMEAEEELTVVFAGELDLTEGDPNDAVVGGTVRMLGAQRGRGGQPTLSIGRFYGSIASDGDGDLGVQGEDKNSVLTRSSAAVPFTGRSALCGDDQNGHVTVPPLAAVTGNGSGTKVATTTTSTRPVLF